MSETAQTSPGGIEVRPIELPSGAGAFIRTWWRVFRDDPHWVPPLIFERKQFFDPRKNPYFKTADVQCFIASRGGEDVGTISATIDHRYQEHEPGVGFFGFFEFVDDDAVARALFDAACGWLRGQGMERLIGPANFNTNHEFGLLVDGFDSDPYVANPHNSAYYEPIYEKLELRKVMDWYAYFIDLQSPDVERLKKISDRLLKRHSEVRIRNLDMKNYARDVSELHKIYDDAWEHNWGHVRITEEEFQHLARGLRSILDPSLCFVAEIEGQVAAISITLPDVNQIVKGMNGRLLPFGWWKLLRARNHVDQMRVFMLGVKQEFQHLPLGAPLYTKTWDRGMELGMQGVEASLILETNERMRGALERMGGRIYKTYRSYEYALR